MGHSMERGSTHETENFLSPEDFRYSLVRNQVQGTLSEMFESGSAISHDGKQIYFANLDPVIPDRYRDSFEAGRIVTCLPQELRIPVPITNVGSRIHIIPPHSDRKLTYSYGRKGGLGIYLLHGLDEKGRPIVDDLFADRSPVHGLKEMARQRLLKHGLNPMRYNPKRIVNESLRDIADRKPDGGLGEYHEAVQRLKDIDETEKSIVEYVNGK